MAAAGGVSGAGQERLGRHAGGRPEEWKPEDLAKLETVLGALRSWTMGERALCELHGFSYETFKRMSGSDQFRPRLVRAREDSAEALADEALRTTEKGLTLDSGPKVQAHKNHAEMLMRMAAVRDRRFSDRPDVQSGGAGFAVIADRSQKNPQTWAATALAARKQIADARGESLEGDE